MASRTGRAEDVFLPGILYNGALAVVAIGSVLLRAPLVGFLVGTALGEPTGWRRDRGMVTMTSRFTLVLAVPYVTRFAVQLPLFLAGQRGAAGRGQGGSGLAAAASRAVFVIGLMLSKGRTPGSMPTPTP